MIPEQTQGTYSLADIRRLAAEGKLSSLLAQPEESGHGCGGTDAPLSPEFLAQIHRKQS
jgi:hypothetical protein